MNPKLSIAVHSGVFKFWPLLQNLLKSFVVCNEYPNIEIMLVESGGNKKKYAIGLRKLTLMIFL